ncbi:MAG: class I SAM-dependent methyltransferase [Gammaproteobacteria bacterium]|nr:hypothetical protein [Gammaproteobacteria bacterium]MBQ14480.1 hypothetical protein [Gammaproteobacteria bacterium]MDP6095502.1 class I SAM-dependent methyltransferase [Gammaproteobacteria bacterium]|tara:strand:+ start:6072 stop:6767 length:696 start_codon:yes stop_codon:yes gene_type:complete
MNRSVTNIIRFGMDELLPRWVRDNKYFMYPFFYCAYRGKNISQAMNFKKLVRTWSDEEYADFYEKLNSISRNRKTDLNSNCIEKLINTLSSESRSLADVGCGNGYLLETIKTHYSNLELTGVDIISPARTESFEFKSGHIEKLPLEDNSVDIICCTHVLEHCLKPDIAIKELKRVARDKIIVVVPKQRPFFYTLDEHVNFYYHKEQLTAEIGLENYHCENIKGDWFYEGFL